MNFNDVSYFLASTFIVFIYLPSICRYPSIYVPLYFYLKMVATHSSSNYMLSSLHLDSNLHLDIADFEVLFRPLVCLKLMMHTWQRYRYCEDISL